MRNRAQSASIPDSKPEKRPSTKRHLTVVRGLTEAVTGIDWKRDFPATSGDGVEFAVSHSDEVAEFVRLNFTQIYHNEQSSFLDREPNERRAYFYEQAGDLFVFRDRERNVGIFVAHLSDWDTYYIRNVSILPKYHSRGIYQAFILRLFQILSRANVGRVEGHIAPNNHRSLKVHSELGFVVTGMVLSERWGGLMQLTKFLNGKSAGVFQRQFCCADFPIKAKKEVF